ncbi:hypothetical protein PUR71_07415 [Streptomyces sp. SP17BM10]|uniref:hypothetical protein n=1 Tax=Streptomyces sp. SP17BM10 TaxID=3002530 RepID=UPI002E79DBF8|nr:hypothetical protein [Streptomyces sp. SP17BM10]MEE1782747.1 hypothetical protein [Streptomyces sp. SP17BM10]
MCWAQDGLGVGSEGWAWFLFDEERIRPLPEPAGPAPAATPYSGTWRDAVVVPRELAGPPSLEETERCWRLAWLRVGGAWASALVTARRRPGPGLPWIALARWGEDKASAWVIADGVTLRPLPPSEAEEAAAAPTADGPLEAEGDGGPR